MENKKTKLNLKFNRKYYQERKINIFKNGCKLCNAEKSKS